MLFTEIDELTPCLVDTITGEQIDTEAVRIRRSSLLQHFTKAKGWYTNWVDELKAGHEVYALMLKGTFSIQGLISLHEEPDMDAVFMDRHAQVQPTTSVFSRIYNTQELEDTFLQLQPKNHSTMVTMDTWLDMQQIKNLWSIILTHSGLKRLVYFTLTR